jgi:hypothetical protein
MNLVEQMLKQFLSGDTLGQFAGAVGASSDDTKKAISAAVPALLSGIGSVASKPEGANKLWSTLKNMDDSGLSDLGGMLTGNKTDELAKSGTSILEALLGKGMLGSLIGALASFLGGKTALVTKLLPMLAPILIGMIGKQVKSGGLDLAGLVKLILGQKGNIAAAMPQGLLSSLSGVQGLGDLTGFAKSATAAVESATKKAGAMVEEAASPLRWLLPVIVVVALLAAIYWWMNRSKPAPAPGTPPAQTIQNAAEDLIEDVAGDATAVSSAVTALFDNAGKTLADVTDAATAQAAVPKLQEMDKEIDSLTSTIGKLPAEAQTAVKSLISTSLKTMQEQADKVLGIAGVGDILKPIIEGIVKKITAIVGG